MSIRLLLSCGLNFHLQKDSGGGRRFPPKNIFNSKAEHPGYPEGAFQGRGVFSKLYGDDRLPCDPDGFSKCCLAHAALSFAQRPYAIRDGGGLCHGSGAPAIEDYLEYVFRYLRQHQAKKDQVEKHVAIEVHRIVPEAP